MQKPQVVINIEINDEATESIRISHEVDFEEKIDRFCKNYKISNDKIVENIKSRVKMILDNANTNSNNNNASTKQPDTFRRMAGSRNKKPKNCNKMQEKKLTLQNLIFCKKPPQLQKPLQPTTKTNRGSTIISTIYNPKQQTLNRNRLTFQKENLKSNSIVSRHIKPKLSIDTSIGLKNQLIFSELQGDSTMKFVDCNKMFTNVCQMRTPVTHANKIKETFLSGVEMDIEAHKHLNNYTQPRVIMKSSFKERIESKEHIPQSIYESCVQIYDNKTYENNSKPKIEIKRFKAEKNDARLRALRTIFDKLDGARLGHVGPANMSLKSLTAEDLKLLKPFIVEIFKCDQGTIVTFHDFCEMVKKFDTED